MLYLLVMCELANEPVSGPVLCFEEIPVTSLLGMKHQFKMEQLFIAKQLIPQLLEAVA
jgi:hypothetical protein